MVNSHGEEKRIIVDNFNVQTFKKNQFIYAEGDEPEYLWCLLKGKVKKLKKVLAVEFRFCASFVRTIFRLQSLLRTGAIRIECGGI